jgi:hypothetical protein
MDSYSVSRILKTYNTGVFSKNTIAFDIKEGEYNPKKNKWVSLHSIPEFSFVRDFINQDLKKIDSSYSVGNFITLLVYEKGGFFAEHKDEDRPTSSPIVLSGGYLLNKDYDGGEFIIEGAELNVKVGELFLFGRDVYHEIKKVKKGTRYALHFGVISNVKQEHKKTLI